MPTAGEVPASLMAPYPGSMCSRCLPEPKGRSFDDEMFDLAEGVPLAFFCGADKTDGYRLYRLGKIFLAVGSGSWILRTLSPACYSSAAAQ